jgi:hypothetical protein
MRYRPPLLDSDIDTERKWSEKNLDQLAFTSVRRAAGALTRSAGLDSGDTSLLSDILEGMIGTHETMGLLLRREYMKPHAVETLSLARGQLELVFSIVLIFSDPDQWLPLYWKDGVAAFVRRYELDFDEKRNLSRWSADQKKTTDVIVDRIASVAGMTSEETSATRKEVLGMPLTSAEQAAHVRQFPTPGRTLQKVSGDRHALLSRLYHMEYSVLSSYVHNAVLTAVERAALRRGASLLSSSELEDFFGKRVIAPALGVSWVSLLLVATEVYSAVADVDLAEALAKAWGDFTELDLLARAVWPLRPKAVLGAIC